MSLSIRTRLTVGFLLIVAAVIAAFGLAVYDLTRQSLLNELDDSVRDHAATFAIAAQPPPGKTVPQIPDLDMFKSPDVFVEIVDPSGSVIGASANLGSQRLPFHPDAIRMERVEDVRLAGSPLILYGRPISSDGQVRGYVLVALAPSPIYLALGRLRMLLFPGAALALLLAGLGSWILVHQAITPLRKLATSAAEITAEGDHARRLNYSGPNNEIGKLAATIDGMLQSLDDAHQRMVSASTAQRRFLADASHELRRPLTIALSSLDVLARVGTSDTDFAARTLDDTRAELDRMARLVTQLLAMARSDSGRPREQSPVLIAETVRGAIAQIRPEADAVVVREPELDGIDDSVVLGNPDELGQVFVNLLDNAVRYTPSGGVICVNAGATDGEIAISITDSGVGISERDLPHVFERFYRGEAGRAREGAGLGLAIVDQYVRQHGGRVVVDRKQPIGTTFTVFLPLLAPSEEPELARRTA
jgi:two-component system, OmpR family, sensor kinase